MQTLTEQAETHRTSIDPHHPRANLPNIMQAQSRKRERASDVQLQPHARLRVDIEARGHRVQWPGLEHRECPLRGFLQIRHPTAPPTESSWILMRRSCKDVMQDVMAAAREACSGEEYASGLSTLTQDEVLRATCCAATPCFVGVPAAHRSRRGRSHWRSASCYSTPARTPMPSTGLATRRLEG